MVVRLGAAICGAMALLACSSAAMARTETRISSHAEKKDLDRGNLFGRLASVGAAIIGAASTYDPFEPGYREGGTQTASGERYNPSAWTAAIQTNLRGMFGGVRYGAKPGYALVEGAGKKAVVKINDVGPLVPGRVIDLNKQTMRYFDPSLQRGVIRDVKVTPLPGDHWTLGPITATQLAQR
jgi:rare lipoprotein A